MTASWRKAIQDVWQERLRALLVVLAIALGVAGFDAVLSTYAILIRELDRGYLATNPASFTVRTDVVDEELARAIGSVPGVSDAEARRAVRGRIKAGPMEWRNLTLFVVKDFGNIRVSKVDPEKGAWPPRAGEVAIERDAFQVARARIGDIVTVRTARGKEQTLRIVGSLHDVGQAQARMENTVYGYITSETLARLGEEPYLDQLKILVAENPFDEKHVRAVAADVAKRIEELKHPVVRLDVPKPGQHPHSDLHALLLLSLASFGVFVLLLSGILVVNLMTALMASQVRQIGVMKAIGATSGQIGRIYFGQALCLGIAAVLVALPVGAAGSRAFCRYLAVFLNFDISSFAVPSWVYLLVAAVGLMVPLLAAAYPVSKGSGVSVREALADFGLSRNTFGTTAFDRALAGLGGGVRPLLLALRNGFRRRARLILTVASLAAGGLFFMTAWNFRASLIRTLDRLFHSRRYDLTVGLGTMSPVEKVERAIGKTAGVLRGEGWIVTEGVLPAAGAKTARGRPDEKPHNGGGSEGPHGGGALAGDRFSVIALPANTKALQLDIAEGRGLSPSETDGIVVNGSLAAKGSRMRVGQTVTFRMGPAETTWRVVGIAREPFSPPVGYVPLGFFEERGHTGVVNSVRLTLDKTDAASIRRVKADLERNLEQEGVRALSATSQSDSRFGFDQHMVMIYVALIVMSCVIGGVGGLGLATTMSLNVLERRREMGVLRAIGASPKVLWSIVMAEGVTVGLLSWALAALTSWPVGEALGSFLVRRLFQSGLDFSFEPAGVLLWLAVSIGLGAVASFLPAWHASRSSVREAIGYE